MSRKSGHRFCEKDMLKQLAGARPDSIEAGRALASLAQPPHQSRDNPAGSWCHPVTVDAEQGLRSSLTVAVKTRSKELDAR